MFLLYPMQGKFFAKIQWKQIFITPSVLSVSSVVKSAFSPKGREFFAEGGGVIAPLRKKFAVRREMSGVGEKHYHSPHGRDDRAPFLDLPEKLRRW